MITPSEFMQHRKPRIGPQSPSQLMQQTTNVQLPELSAGIDPYDAIMNYEKRQAKIKDQTTMYNLMDPILNTEARRKLSSGTWYDDIPVFGEVANTAHGYADIASRMFDVRDPATMLMTTLRFFGETFDLTSSLTIKPFLHSHQYGTSLSESYATITGFGRRDGRYNYWFGDYNESIDFLPENWVANIIGEMAIDPSFWITLGVGAIPGATGASRSAGEQAAKQFARQQRRVPNVQAKRNAAQVLDEATIGNSRQFSRAHISTFKDPVEAHARMTRANKALLKADRADYKRQMLAFKRNGDLYDHISDAALDSVYDRAITELGAKRFYRALVAFDKKERQAMQVLKQVSPIRVTKQAGQKAWRHFKQVDLKTSVRQTARYLEYDDVNRYTQTELEQTVADSTRNAQRALTSGDSEAYSEAVNSLTKAQALLSEKKSVDYNKKLSTAIDAYDREIVKQDMHIKRFERYIARQDISHDEKTRYFNENEAAYKEAKHNRDLLQSQKEQIEEQVSGTKRARANFNKIKETSLEHDHAGRPITKVKSELEYETKMRRIEKLQAKVDKTQPEFDELTRLTAETKIYGAVRELLDVVMSGGPNAEYVTSRIMMRDNYKVRNLILDFSRDHFKAYEAIADKNKAQMDEAIRLATTGQKGINELVQEGKLNPKAVQDSIYDNVVNKDALIDDYIEAVNFIKYRDLVADIDGQYKKLLTKEHEDFHKILTTEYDVKELTAEESVLGSYMSSFKNELMDALRDVNQITDKEVLQQKMTQVNQVLKQSTKHIVKSSPLARLYPTLKKLNSYMSPHATKDGKIVSSTKFFFNRARKESRVYNRLRTANAMEYAKKGKPPIRKRYDPVLEDLNELKDAYLKDPNTEHKTFESFLNAYSHKFSPQQRRNLLKIVARTERSGDVADFVDVLGDEVNKVLRRSPEQEVGLDKIIRTVERFRNEERFLKEKSDLEYMVDLFDNTMIRTTDQGKLTLRHSVIKAGGEEHKALIISTYQNLKEMQNTVRRMSNLYSTNVKHDSASELHHKLSNLLSKSQVADLDARISQDFYAQHLAAVRALSRSSEGALKIQGDTTKQKEALIANFKDALNIPANEVVTEDIVVGFTQEILEDARSKIYRLFDDYLGQSRQMAQSLSKLNDPVSDGQVKRKKLLHRKLKSYLKERNDDELIKAYGKGAPEDIREVLHRLGSKHVTSFEPKEMQLLNSILYRQEFQPVYQFMQNLHMADYFLGGELKSSLDRMHKVFNVAQQMTPDSKGLLKTPKYLEDYIKQHFPQERVYKTADLTRSFLYLESKTPKENLSPTQLHNYYAVQKFNMMVSRERKEINYAFQKLKNKYRITNDATKKGSKRSKEMPFAHLSDIESENAIFGTKFFPTDKMADTNTMVYDSAGQPYQGTLSFKDSNYVFLDFETTGLDLGPQGKDQVFQIGLTKVGVDGTEEHFNYYLDIGKMELSDKIKKMTGHQGDAYKNALAKQHQHGKYYHQGLDDNVKVQRAVNDIIDDDSIVFAHNASFDIKGLEDVLGEGHGRSFPIVDTYPLFQLQKNTLEERFERELANAMSSENYRQFRAKLNGLYQEKARVESTLQKNEAILSATNMAELNRQYRLAQKQLQDSGAEEELGRIRRLIAKYEMEPDPRMDADDILELDRMATQHKDRFAKTAGFVDHNAMYKIEKTQKDRSAKKINLGLNKTERISRRGYVDQLPLNSTTNLNADSILSNIFDAVTKNLLKQEGGFLSSGDLQQAYKVALGLKDYHTDYVASKRQPILRSGRLVSTPKDRIKRIEREIAGLESKIEEAYKAQRAKPQLERIRQLENTKQEHLAEVLLSSKRKKDIKKALQNRFKDSTMQDHNAAYDTAILKELTTTLAGSKEGARGSNRMLHSMLTEHGVKTVADLNNSNVGRFTTNQIQRNVSNFSSFKTKVDQQISLLEKSKSSSYDESIYEELTRASASLEEAIHQLETTPHNRLAVHEVKALVEDAHDAFHSIERDLTKSRELAAQSTPVEYNVAYSAFDSAVSEEDTYTFLEELSSELGEHLHAFQDMEDLGMEQLEQMYGDRYARPITNKLLNSFTILDAYDQNTDLHDLVEVMKGNTESLTDGNDKTIAAAFRKVIDDYAEGVGVAKEATHADKLARFRQDNENQITQFFDLIDDTNEYRDFMSTIYTDMQERMIDATPADKEIIRLAAGKSSDFMQKLERNFKRMVDKKTRDGETILEGDFDAVYNDLINSDEMSPLIQSKNVRKRLTDLKATNYQGIDTAKQIHNYAKKRVNRYLNENQNEMRLFVNVDTATSHELYYTLKENIVDPLLAVESTGEAWTDVLKEHPVVTRIRQKSSNAIQELRRPLRQIKMDNNKTPFVPQGAINRHINELKQKGLFYEDFAHSGELITRNEAYILQMSKATKQATRNQRRLYDLTDGLVDPATEAQDLPTHMTKQSRNVLGKKLDGLVSSITGSENATADTLTTYFKRNSKNTKQRIIKQELMDSILSFEENDQTIRSFMRIIKDIEDWAVNQSYLKKNAEGVVDPDTSAEFMNRLKASLFEYIEEVEPMKFRNAMRSLYSQGFTRKEVFQSKMRHMEDFREIASSTKNSYDLVRNHFGQGRQGAQKMYNFIRQNPDEYNMVSMTFDSKSKSGVSVKKLDIRSADDILELDQMAAQHKDRFAETVGVVDQNTMYKMQRGAGQQFKFKRNSVPDKIRRHYVMPLKSTMLMNANFVLSNIFDAVTKNLLKQEGGFLSPDSVLKDTVKAGHMYRHYTDMWQEAQEAGITFRQLKSKKNPWIDDYENYLREAGLLTEQKQRHITEARFVNDFLDEPAASGQFQEMLMNAQESLIGRSERSTSFERAINTMFYGQGPLAWNMQLNSRVEIYSRLALHINDINKGLTKQESLAKILKTHYNYVDKSQEELYAEFVIPFMSFPIRSFLFWADAFHDNPVQTKFLSKMLYRSWGQEELQENEYARYQMARGRMPIGDYAMNPGFTFQDSLAIMGGREDAPVPFSDQATRKLNPIAKNLLDTDRPMGERAQRMPGISQFSQLNKSVTALDEGDTSMDTHFPSLFDPYSGSGAQTQRQQTQARHPQFSEPYSYNKGNIIPSASRSIRWRMTNLDRFKRPGT